MLVHCISFLIVGLTLLLCVPSPPIVNKYPFVECFSSFLCFPHWFNTVRVGELKKAVVAVVVCIWTDRTSVTTRSGYAQVEHGNDSSRSSPVEGVNTR